MTNRRALAVPGDDESFVGKCEQLVPDRTKDRVAVAAPEIRSTDALAKEGVARDNDGVLACDGEAKTAGRVARRMEGRDFDAPGAYGVAIAQEAIDLCKAWRSPRHAEGIELHLQAAVQKHVRFVQKGNRTRICLDVRRRAHVIEMRVRVKHRDATEAVFGQDPHNLLGFAAGVDDDGVFGELIANNDAIAPKRRDREVFENHARDCIPCGKTLKPRPQCFRIFAHQ